MKKEKSLGSFYLNLALYTFAVLTFEFLAILVANVITFGEFTLALSSEEIRNVQFITIERLITCTIWGMYSYFIIKYVEKKQGWNVLEKTTKLKGWQWVVAFSGIIFALIRSYYAWNGFKPYIEFLSNGAYGFVLQYIYYFFEVILFTLIIVFGQKAFEYFFKRENIPYGGIVVALTWGLVHWLTKGTLFDGLYGMVNGFLFGGMYLLMGRDVKKSFLLLYFMFII